MGGGANLNDAIAGGTWSSSDPSIATVDPTGIVSGVAFGSVTISYTVSGCTGGPFTTTYAFSVVPLNTISGAVHFPAGPIDTTGTVKIWLITYNPSSLMLEAVDSVLSTTGSLYERPYQFVLASTDSYRVKAAYFPPTFAATGYVPTYHYSSLHWSMADVFYHTYGIPDDGVDIVMQTGAVTSGPGFIGGNVTTGANKGTAGTVPAVGMLMQLFNTTSGSVVQQAYTDATGAYSFSNLATGTTYTVYPEAINYATTPIASVNLSAGSPSVTNASFIQHTLSKTITPKYLQLPSTTQDPASIEMYPNPCNETLFMRWAGVESEQATVRVFDITGSAMVSKIISSSNGAGTTSFDVSQLPQGMYLVNFKAANIDKTSKIFIEK